MKIAIFLFPNLDAYLLHGISRTFTHHTCRSHPLGIDLSHRSGDERGPSAQV